jgi:hypothetical protein
MREKKKRRADKFEELVAALYEFDHWINNQRRQRAYGEALPDTISPFAKLQSISSVYFPQFDKQIGELSTATSGYRVWMGEFAKKRIEGRVNPKEEDGFSEAYGEYLDKLNKLLDALKEFARKEFQ